MPPAGNNNSNNNQSNMGNQMPPTMPNQQPQKVDDGNVFSIIGLVLAFFGMQLIGLILSIVGLNKAKKAGASKGLAIAGIVLNAIGLVVATIFIILLIIGAFTSNETITSNSNTNNNNPSYNSGSSNNSRQSVTATDSYDYDKVCTNKYSVSNAADYTKGSATVVAFYNSESSSTYYTNLYDIKDSWRVDNDTPGAVQLVACLDFKGGSMAGKDCQFESDGENVSIPLYHSQYKLTVYEAKTGEVVTSEDIETNTNECPSFASYIKSDPKVYETPSGDLIEGVLTPYAG